MRFTRESIDAVMLKFQQVMDAMNGETDRGCALLGSALLEEKLADALKHKFHKEAYANPETSKEINRALDPANEKSLIGGAMARARMCLLLGIIDMEALEAFKRLFRLRNGYFAHSLRPALFSDPSIQQQLDQLFGGINEFNELFDVALGHQDNSPRRKFIAVVSYLYYFVEAGMIMQDQHLSIHQMPVPPRLQMPPPDPRAKGEASDPG